AVEGPSGSLTYRDLDDRSRRIATALAARGVGPGTTVPLLLHRSVDFVVAVVGIVRCGAAYAPIDLNSPPARQRVMIDDLDRAPLVIAARPDSAPDGSLAVVSVADLTGHPHAGDSWPCTSPDDPLYVMYTSGSTGRPKAVVVPHRGVVRLVVNADYADFTPPRRWGLLSSVAFDASTLELWGALLNGSACVVQETPLPSLEQLAAFLVDGRITDTWLTASLFNAMVDEHPEAFAGFKQLFTGGERESVPHMRAFLERFPQVRLVHGYGPTENTTFSLCHTVRPEDTRAARVPIGTPIRGTTIRIVPVDRADERSTTVGELLVGGDGLALGYRNDPDLTAGRFVEHDGVTWYRTGDLVERRDDGVVEFVGRVDRQVKLQGHRIELEEIERVLAACPGVGSATVMVVGETAEQRHLVACYTASNGQGPSVETLRAYLAGQLPAPAVPRVLRALPQLPINTNGKVDRDALLALLATDRVVDERNSPDSGAERPGAFATAFVTGTEEALASIWQRWLPPQDLRRDSHFQSCGGTSLLSLRVAADIRRHLGRRVSPVEIMLCPVLSEQARRVDLAPAVEGEGDRRLASGSTGRAEPGPALASIQRRILWASSLDRSGCAYLVHTALEFPVGLGEDAVRPAFEQVAARHDALRLRIVAAERDESSEPHVQITDALPDGWWRHHGVVPTGARSSAVHHDRIDGSLLPLLSRPLDLERDGVMRVDAWTRDDGRMLVVWTVHHLAVDDWSVRQVLDELAALVDRRALPPAGAHVDLVKLELEVERADSARATERSTTRAKALLQALAGTKHLPIDPLPAPGGELDIQLDADTQASLARTAAMLGSTPFVPLLHAFGQAIQDVFGPSWRFVLTPFSRRVVPEAMEAVGCCLDLQLVEAGRRPDESPAVALARIRQEALDGQRLSFGSLDRTIDAIAAVRPELAQAPLLFAMTWREHTAPDLACRAGAIHVRRVPQAAARFGVTLHGERSPEGVRVHIEASDEVLESGTGERLAEAIQKHLGSLAGVHGLDAFAQNIRNGPPDQPLPSKPAAGVRRHAAACARAWEALLGAPPTGPESEFLAEGGTSLLALRLAAAIKRTTGVPLDLGAFLAAPTFGALCDQVAQATIVDDRGEAVVLGHPGSGPMIVVIPGTRGHAVEMHRLVEHLRAHLPEEHPFLVVSLAEIIARIGDEGGLEDVLSRIVPIVEATAACGVGAIVGHSIGGLIALELSHRLAASHNAAPVWLLDTYDRSVMRGGRRGRALRTLVGAIREGRNGIGYLRQALARPRYVLPPGADDGHGVRWRRLGQGVYDLAMDYRAVDAHLIRSAVSAREIAALRRPATNAFDPRRFRSFTVTNVDIPHSDLVGSGVDLVAQVLAQEITTTTSEPNRCSA
ncbi:MAG: amino acid adenylation domain-containing protein, partial [Phycisphaerales bacterium]|nr:amino acid adenylation domain-containing protein [Phycisphaerales bacterium]